MLWAELYLLPEIHVEILTPRTSEAGCTWRWGLKKVIKFQWCHRVGLDQGGWGYYKMRKLPEFLKQMTIHKPGRQAWRNQLCQHPWFQTSGMGILKKFISVQACVWHFIMAALVIWYSGEAKQPPKGPWWKSLVGFPRRLSHKESTCQEMQESAGSIPDQEDLHTSRATKRYETVTEPRPRAQEPQLLKPEHLGPELPAREACSERPTHCLQPRGKWPSHKKDSSTAPKKQIKVILKKCLASNM